MKGTRLKWILLLVIAASFLVFLTGCNANNAVNPDRSERIALYKSAGYRPELAGKRIGVMEGSTSEQYLNANHPESTVLVFKSNSDAVAALRAGKADFVFMLDMEAFRYERYSDDLLYCVNPFLTEGHAISVNKQKPELRDAIDDVIGRFRANGTMDAIIKRWLVEKTEAYKAVDVPEVADGPVLKVAITSTREPMIFNMNGTVQGLCIELVKRIALELGMKIEFSDMDFAGSLAAVTSGKCDIALATSITEERKKSVDFAGPYMEVYHVMLTKIDADPQNRAGFGERMKDMFNQTFVAEDRWKLIANGFGVTLLIAISSLLSGSALGFGLCALKLSKKKAANRIAGAYCRIVQGLPLLVILMLLYYVLFAKVEIGAISVAVIAFSLTFASGASEIFKTGIQVVDKGQTEAALASGFTRAQAFAYITVPQAARVILPVYVGEFVTMLKLTSIVGYISIQDLTKASDIIRSRTYEAFFPILVIAAIYFVTILIFVEVMKAVGRKLDPMQKKRLAKGEKAQ